MLSPFRLAAAALHGLHLLIRPGHLPAVFGIVRAMNTPDYLADRRALLSAHPHGARALHEEFRLSIDLPFLRTLPEGTLGRAFADFVDEHQISPQVLTDQTRDQVDWTSIHLYEVHDIWHVLLDIGTHVEGEVELLSFMLAQIPMERLAPFALGIALLRGALGSRELTTRGVHDAIARGYERGKRSAPLFGVDWSDHRSQDLAELRCQFRLEPAPTSRGAGALRLAQA